MIDPRIARIKKVFGRISYILGVVSGKGGVGKTTISVLLALVLRDLNFRVGLLDLDFYGPNCHVVLGIDKFGYREEKGINPHVVDNIQFVSIVPFLENKYFAARGEETRNALVELLSIINWNNLDFLIIDMPPGMGDILIEILRLLPSINNIVVSTQSRLSQETVKRLIEYLKTNKFSILGLIENMVHDKPALRDFASQLGVKYLGYINFDASLEKHIGNPKSIRKTTAYKQLKEIVRRINEWN